MAVLSPHTTFRYTNAHMAQMLSSTVVRDERAVVQEIFSGIQGEGVLVGQRQIFVRFHGCNLDCAFCDTPASQGTPPAQCAIEERAGSRTLTATPNPLTVTAALAAIQRLQAGYPHHSVSLTGGEPLLRQGYLDVLLPALRAAHLRSFLETNGTLAAAFTALSLPPDFVAMDIKLPTTSGLSPCWEAHAAFLDTVTTRIGTQHERSLCTRLQVKIVFGEDSLEDVACAAALLAEFHPAIPCILQPVTPHPGGPFAPGAALVLEAQRRASRVLRDVRVIPQTHVMLGQW